MTFTFDPPGHLDDLDEAQKRAWHGWISAQMDKVQAGDPSVNDGPRTQFFNAARIAPDADAVTEDISWPAFPRQVQIGSIGDVARWRRADSTRMVQDEYCEWSIRRDGAGRIVRIDFTCEGPEYWAFLAQVNPEKALALYREHVNPAVAMRDIYPRGSYDPHNRWNVSTSEGAMHLIQPSNSLHAEIELAGGASIVRLDAYGVPREGAAELIACGRYGAPERHSDPHIGDRVNAHARAKADITLANPVGLYIDGVDLDDLAPPHGDAADLFTYTRGSAGHPVRMVAQAPEGAGFVLGEVLSRGRPIEYGGQIADRIRIKLTGLVTRVGRTTGAPVQGCVGDVATTESAAALSVEAAIESQQVRGRR